MLKSSAGYTISLQLARAIVYTYVSMPLIHGIISRFPLAVSARHRSAMPEGLQCVEHAHVVMLWW
jgi:hypothetical protein